MENDFLKTQQQGMEVLGFWSENYRNTIINGVMRMYKKEIIKEWVITDIVFNGDKVLVKWQKRIIPLSDEELSEF